MAKSNVGYVNVGSLVNPTEGLSRSLSDLSNMYGRQADRQQAEESAAATKAENDRRWDIQQRQTQKEQQFKDAGREAKGITNDWISGIRQGSVKYDLKDYSGELQEHFRRAKKRIVDEDKAFRKYLLDGTDESLTAAGNVFKSGMGGNVDKGKPNSAEITRKQNLQALRLELDSIKDPAAKKARIDEAMGSLFSGRAGAIDEEIASGDSLVKKQKLAAIMRRMPEATRLHGDYGSIYNTLEKTLYGHTERSLLDNESLEVKAYNAAQKNQYTKDYARYKESNKKNAPKYGALVKILKEDYGWEDNEDKEDIINVMLAKNIDPDSIAFSIAMATDDGWLGKSLPDVDSDEALKLINAAEARKNAQEEKFERPDSYTPRSIRTLPELQKDLLKGKLRNSSFNNVLEVAQKWKDKLLERGQPDVTEVPKTVTDTSRLPLPLGGTSVADSMIKNGEFNPSEESVNNVLSRSTPTSVNVPRLGSLDPSSAVKRTAKGKTGTEKLVMQADRLGDYINEIGETINRNVADYQSRKLSEFENTRDPVQITARKARSAAAANGIGNSLLRLNVSPDYRRVIKNSGNVVGDKEKRIIGRNKKITDQALMEFKKEIARGVPTARVDEVLGESSDGPYFSRDDLIAINSAQEKISNMRPVRQDSKPELMDRLSRLVNTQKEVSTPNTTYVGGAPSEASKLVGSVDKTIDTSLPEYKYTTVDDLPKSSLKAYIRALNRMKPADGSLMSAEDYKAITEAALKGHLDPA